MHINELAKEYKETKSTETLNLIFKNLKAYLKKKATYVFYQQKFIKGTYEIEEFDKISKKIVKKERVSTFKLCDTKKIELEDVEQELYLKVLELLQKYDISRPFENYLNATLTNWRPEFIRNFNFVHSLNTINESELPDRYEREGSLDDIAVDNPEVVEIDDLFSNLTENEKKFIDLKRQNPDKNQTQLAGIMGVTQQRVQQILQSLKKKCNYRL